MQYRTGVVLTLVAAVLSADIAEAQREPGRRGGSRPGGASASQAGETGDKGGIKSYDEVITDEAITKTGLFLVHQLDDKVYYEIPVERLDTDMLWVTQIAKTQAGFGYGGTPAGSRVVRWERRGDKLLLRDVKYSIRADGDDPISNAVEATSVNPIIMAFDIAAWGKDQRPVIDVTKLLTTDVKEFSAASRLSASGVDSSRTFIDNIKAFPENIETKVLMTYRLSAQGAQPQGFPRRGGARRDPTQGAVTAQVHHSMVLLPANPMTPREHDARVGFFTVGFQDYGNYTEHQVEEVRYIARWRLEKQDPTAEVSDPVKPIVFYVGRGVPGAWRSYVKQGIEMWRPAFEAAGFSNAIIALDAPSPQEDPDWDAEDSRISSIRWLPSTVENAMGPHVSDPRTGEILEADVLVYHNILKLIRDWYFVQASPSDERAQTLPMPDELIGELLAYVIAHEVGHSLGFPHNMKASSAYTVAQLRNPEFTRTNGTEASIMDYGRFNYVAQPGDGATLIPMIGPYDFFGIEWGYRQFADQDATATGLAELVARQKDDPMLLFGPGNSREDPTDQTEDLGRETILATELGLRNIDRVAGYLVAATSKPGEDYSLLENMYNQLLGQRNRELGHVANVVGGFDKRNFFYGDADLIYHALDASLQREAVSFLNQNAFHVPASLIDEDILRRIEASGAADRILSGQNSILRSLMSESRIKRMAEHADRSGDDAYAPQDLLVDLRTGIFSELQESVIEINLYRRNLQRSFAHTLSDLVRQEDASTDLPALARGELVEILEMIKHLENGTSQQVADLSRLHLADMASRIERALDAEVNQTAPTAAPTGQFGRRGID